MSEKAPENSDDEQWSRYLESARDLVTQIEKGEYKKAESILSELNDWRVKDLYTQIGELTRELHDKINSFVDDSRLLAITQTEIPDARERLKHVIKLTEESAHNTLGVIESSMPIVDTLGSKAEEIKKKWQLFMQDKKGVEVLRSLIHEHDDYLQQVIDDAGSIHNNLFDVLMAQGFQDITGQVIQRVINVVEELENSLVGILEASGVDLAAREPSEGESKDGNKGHGPVVPGVNKGDVVNGQDDVDDLLSNLGF